MAEKELPLKQQLFVQNYLKNGCENATQAAIDSGYSKHTAGSQGGRLLKRVDVAAAIKTAVDERAARVMVTADDVLREIWGMAKADMRDAFNPDGTMKSVVDMPKVLRDRMAGFEVETVHEPMKHKNGKPVKDKQGNQVYQVRGMLTKVRFTPRERLLELTGKHVGVKAFREGLDANLTGKVTFEIIDFNKETPTENPPA